MQCLAPQLISNAGVITWGKEERRTSKGESGAKDGRCQRGNKGVRRKKKAKQANGAQDKHRRTKQAIMHDGSSSR